MVWPEFMGQRAHVVILAVVVQQHVGMHVIRAAAEYAPEVLPSLGIHIDPALGESPLGARQVFGAERGQRGKNVASLQSSTEYFRSTDATRGA